MIERAHRITIRKDEEGRHLLLNRDILRHLVVSAKMLFDCRVSNLRRSRSEICSSLKVSIRKCQRKSPYLAFDGSRT